LRSALQRPAAVESLTLYRFQRATRAASGIEAPSLEQILQALPESQPLNLEIKRRGAEPKAIARALAAALGDRSQVLLSSFDWPLLAELAGRLPGTPVAPIADRHANALLAAAIELRSFSLHCHRRIARRSLFLTAARAGQPVLVYTVNRPRLARDLVRRGARGLFTDFPGRLRMSLERDSR
jgi:glycerophosphoryl diester phosphodiesterase